MIIGIDFDNTIVSYDDVFFRAARDRGLIPDDFVPLKEEIRDALRASGREDDWTELQSYVYGQYIADASAFPGVIDFFRFARREGHAVRIISHKTERPYRGPPLDLRGAARSWLTSRRFLESAKTGLSLDVVYFEETRQDKLRRIAECGCDMFVDDLPEFLSEPNFPQSVQRVLFDPQGRGAAPDEVVACRSWEEIRNYVLQRMTK